MLELLADPSVWVALVTLSMLEIVLGIDNIIFISILVGRLPEARREKARIVGLALAMVTRVALLFSIVEGVILRRADDPTLPAEATADDIEEATVRVLGARRP
mgnify:CR=1 FL=1